MPEKATAGRPAETGGAAVPVTVAPAGVSSRLRSTDAARAAVARIRAVRGQVAFVQPVRAETQDLPLCVLSRDFFIAPADRRVGDVDGCPFYVDADLDDSRGRPSYELDVAVRGAAPGWAAALDGQFVVRRAA